MTVTTAVGEVIGVQEFAPRLAAAPHAEFACATLLGVVHAANQPGNDVRAAFAEIVVRPVKIGGQHAHGIEAVLAAVGLAHLDAGELGDGIGIVGGLERAGQQVFLAHRLRRELRVDAARSQEHQFGDAEAIRRVDDVGLDQQVVANEIRRRSEFAMMPPTRAAARITTVGRASSKIAIDGARLREIEAAVRLADDVACSPRASVRGRSPSRRARGARRHRRCRAARTCRGVAVHSCDSRCDSRAPASARRVRPAPDRAAPSRAPAPRSSRCAASRARLGARRIAQQGVDLGGTEIARIDAHHGATGLRVDAALVDALAAPVNAHAELRARRAPRNRARCVVRRSPRRSPRGCSCWSISHCAST